ncbi:MAG: hypothetical protein H7Z40_16630 [Phycisphaerae bacterium]|nr:hypothetical protein [Gemmatimonadaceae bacterium]
MIAPALLLAVCQIVAAGPDSTYSSVALAKMVDMASQANRRVPAPLLGYRALIESEVALLVNTPGGADGAVAGTAAATTEAAAQIEQFVLKANWARSGVFQQEQVGYRARMLGPSISALNILPRPWTAPALYGNRLSLLFGGAPSLRTADTIRRAMPAVHPFADDRAEFYRYSGGDTVTNIRISADRSIPIVLIFVEPIVERHKQLMVFAGEVYIDGTTGEIVRLHGRIRVGPVKQSAASRLVRMVAQVQEVGYVDFENSLQQGKYWLPVWQRLEYQAITSFTEARATIRVQSVWRDVELSLRDSLTLVAAGDTLGEPQYSVRHALAGDTSSGWGSWSNDIGALTANASARDFDDVAPPEFRPDGPAQFRWQARGFSDMIRVNRVEGVFIGVAGLIDFRETAPGVSLRLFGGWATSANTLKGGAEAVRVRGPWVVGARAERQLASTNDFALSLGGGGGNLIGSLFGVENYDWVDRRILSASLTREFGIKHASSLRAEIAAGDDRDFSSQLKHGLFGGDFRPNRPVTRGSYVRSRAQFDIGRNIITSPLASGLGATLVYERGSGALDWQRSQFQGFAQQMFGRFIFAARVDAAAVAGDAIPVQQLLEVGGNEGLPGYDYKEFAGNQGLVTRTTLAFLLPVLEKPLRLGRLVLPAIGPQLQVGLYSGVTSATGSVAAQLRQLDWATTDGWRSTLDARVRFFGGAFSLGASRPVDRTGPWKFNFGIGGAL